MDKQDVVIADGYLKIEINLDDIMESVSDEERARYSELLVVNDSAMTAAVDLLIHGSTNANGFWRCESNREWLEPHRARVIERLDAIMFEAPSGAITRRLNAEEQEKRLGAWAWKMFHAWPEEHHGSRPWLDNDPARTEKYMDAYRVAEREAKTIIEETKAATGGEQP
jgi:hypothetical protein